MDLLIHLVFIFTMYNALKSLKPIFIILLIITLSVNLLVCTDSE